MLVTQTAQKLNKERQHLTPNKLAEKILANLFSFSKTYLKYCWEGSQIFFLCACVHIIAIGRSMHYNLPLY